jgi:hypothetical protein
MTQFDKFREGLAQKGFRLLCQWEVRREQGRLACYAVRGSDCAPNVHEIMIFHWPDGGYDSYLPPIVNSIEADIALICP